MKIHCSLGFVGILFFGIWMITYSHGSDYASIAALLNHYKNEIVSFKDLDEDVRESFLTVEQPKDPGVITADFDGDGKDDVALLTKRQGSGALTLRFFLCKKQCKEIKAIDLGVFDGLQSIMPIKKGEVIEPTKSLPALTKIKPIRLSNPGVHFGVYGKMSVAYFWDKERQDFVSIVTSD